MTVESAFTTQNPDVLALHRAYLDEVERFHEQREAIAEQWGRRVYFSNTRGYYRIMGLEPTNEDAKYDAELPEGMRMEKKRSPKMLVPALRSAKGKATQKEWDALTVSPPRYPGMPEEVWASADGFSSNIFWPGFLAVDDTLWCGWGTSAERVRGEVSEESHRKVATGFDPEIWEQRKLSEYYSMKEARDAAART